MAIELNEMENHLRELGLTSLDNKDKELLLKKFASSENKEHVFNQLEVIFYLNKMFVSTYKVVNVTNMFKTVEDFKDYIIPFYGNYVSLKAHLSGDILFERFRNEVYKKITGKVAKNNDVDATNYEKIKDELYLEMMDASQADRLLKHALYRSKNFLEQTNVDSLKKLIRDLKTHYGFLNEELIQISKRAATFFSKSSVAKVHSLEKNLDEFKNYINDELTKDKEEKAKVLLNKSFKDVLINSSTIATVDTDTISETIRFLKGEELSKIVPVNKEIKDFKGEFTSSQLAKIYHDSITSLGISVKKVEALVMGLNDNFSSSFNKTLNTKGLINGNNFSSIALLDYEDFENGGKCKQIFELLENFLTDDELNKLLYNHLGFLSCSVNEVKQGLKNAIMESSDDKSLKKNVMSKIRNYFDKNKGEFVEVERKESVVNKRLMTVNFKELNEEKLENLLGKLNANEEEIGTFIKNWNKEEKLFNELLLEEALTTLYDHVSSLNELLNESFYTKEDLLDNTSAVKELYEEYYEEYLKVLNENKIPKKLLELNDKVNESFVNVAHSINERFDLVIKEYEGLFLERKKEMDKIKESIYKYNDKVKEFNESVDKVESRDSLKEEIEIRNDNLDQLNEVAMTIKRHYNSYKKDDTLVMNTLNGIKGMFKLDREEYDFNDYEFVYKMLLSELEKEGLLNERQVGSDRVDVTMSFESFMEEYLEPEEIDFVEQLRDTLVTHSEHKKYIEDLLKDGLHFFDIECESIDNIETKRKELNEHIKEYQEELDAKVYLFRRIETLERQLNSTDTELMEQEQDKLADELTEMNKEMKKIKDKKIKL